MFRRMLKQDSQDVEIKHDIPEDLHEPANEIAKTETDSCDFEDELPDLNLHLPTSSLPPPDELPDLTPPPADSSNSNVDDKPKVPSIVQIRQKVLQNAIRSASIMALKYNKRKRMQVAEFQVGQSVSVEIPKLDRASTNPQRLSAKVIQVSGDRDKAHMYAVHTNGNTNEEVKEW
ncbi:hypothetical protein GQR58_016116 [Nymphon striatum]|nr:hypothetical protein GQR58_016116 [Nymphon striatum]